MPSGEVPVQTDETGQPGDTARSGDAPAAGGAKGMLYEGGIRVPLVMRWPGRVRAGDRCAEPVLGLDLYPTLLEVCGAPRPEQPLDGVSLTPLWAPDGGLDRAALFWHFPAYLEAYRGLQGAWRITPSGAIRAGKWKLIERFETGAVELYDLSADLGETRDLSRIEEERTAELLGQLRAWREAIDAPVPNTPEPAYVPQGDR